MAQFNADWNKGGYWRFNQTGLSKPQESGIEILLLFEVDNSVDTARLMGMSDGWYGMAEVKISSGE